MALAPGPEQGPLGGAAVQEYCPELLLNPSLNQPNPCPNLEPPENPLRRLLVPEERKCPQGLGEAVAKAPSPSCPFFPSPPHFTAGAAQNGSSK